MTHSKTATFFLVALLSFCPHQLQAQQTPPFETITYFFDAFHAKDSVALASFFDSKAQMAFTALAANEKPAKRNLVVQEFVKRVSNRAEFPVWEERLGEPSVTIHQNLATVWVPFQFYLDGVFSHSGHNLFQLFWEGNKWKILYLADTREKTKRN